MFDALDAYAAELDEVESRLADPAVHADPAEARRLGRRHSTLRPIVAAYRAHQAARADADAAVELAADDASFAGERDALEARVTALTHELEALLAPRDPLDDSDVIMQVKAGEGGDESALFAADLVRMYTRYAERRGWRTEILDGEQSDLGGVRDATIAIKARGVAAPGEAPYARLKFEGGVHRVQRVPVTESQGRIHTSAAGVLIAPETEEVAVEIDPNDLRIDVFRSSGPGGQSVNTTDSAVRITHLPTGLVVSCQNEKSQLQNKESAMRILRARLIAMAEEAAAKDASDARRAQVRTVDRSERIRTYNFPENRITDHRVGYKSYNLDQVLDGDLDAVTQAGIDAATRAAIEAPA